MGGGGVGRNEGEEVTEGSGQGCEGVVKGRADAGMRRGGNGRERDGARRGVTGRIGAEWRGGGNGRRGEVGEGVRLYIESETPCVDPPSVEVRAPHLALGGKNHSFPYMWLK